MVAKKIFLKITQHVTVQREEHARYALRSIILVYTVSSTKRKTGPQKVIPNINTSLLQATVPMLMAPSVN